MTRAINYFRAFLRDVKAQRMRTAMTLFGIVWGTAAVTLLLAFGESFQRQMEISFKGLGDNIVIAWPSRTSRTWEGLPRGRRVRMTRDDIALLEREVPEISGISPEVSTGELRLRVGRTVIVPRVSGVDPVFGLIRNMIPSERSRFLNPLDLDGRRRVTFVGDALARDLFGEADAVGEHVWIDGVPFLVIGVLEPKSQDSSYSGRDEDKAVIPSTTFEAMYGRRYIDNFVFQVADPADAPLAQEKVVATLARKYRFDPADREAVMMWDTTEQMRFFTTFFTIFRVFLGVVGALTLVVGGIGVSNIMSVVVEERTKETGIKMALGATRGYVIGGFLFETLLLVVSGGALGLLLSWLVCAAFPESAGEMIGDPVISAPVAATTAAILGAIGLLAGYFPARRAADMDPVEALRL